MFWQCPVLAIQPRTTRAGVLKPVAMFSPTLDQRKPVAEMRAAKSARWLKSRRLTIVFVQPWADRFRRAFSARAGSPRSLRCWSIRQTTARCRAGREVVVIRLLAWAHPRPLATAIGTRDIDAITTAVTATARTARVQGYASPRHSEAVSLMLIAPCHRSRSAAFESAPTM